MRVLPVRRAQPVADDLLHVLVNVQIEEAVAHPRGARLLATRRNETRLSGIMLVEIFDDDARLRHRLAARWILQHRKFSDRPQRAKRRALALVLQVDQLRRERRIVLVKRDQHLVAERGKWMEVQRRRHVILLNSPGERAARSHVGATQGPML